MPASARKYTFGRLAVAGGYWEIGAPQSASDVWLGASMDFAPGTVRVQIQRLRQDNPTGAEREGTAFGVGCGYPLSRRTSLYASYGRTDNNDTASFGVTSSSGIVAAGAPGADPSALALGIRHNF